MSQAFAKPQTTRPRLDEVQLFEFLKEQIIITTVALYGCKTSPDRTLFDVITYVTGPSSSENTRGCGVALVVYGARNDFSRFRVLKRAEEQKDMNSNMETLLQSVRMDMGGLMKALAEHGKKNFQHDPAAVVGAFKKTAVRAPDSEAKLKEGAETMGGKPSDEEKFTGGEETLGGKPSDEEKLTECVDAVDLNKT
ncbi:hypothetical protein EJ04DRAFT_560818 [Polyplosphaeria fusca]|uniref:Uncharacterized protein n=1 Tax=Polyplosphaeria fusca TaxID=682080 RepID=A0A9P4R2J9_9PLEO|nr:hypothetical protein EJ04DRAFT_560818 [Polyplosphaeria fusca]